MTLTFIIVATVAFVYLAVAWSSSTWLNIFLKGTFIVLAVWGAFTIAVESGFVVKVDKAPTAQAPAKKSPFNF